MLKPIIDELLTSNGFSRLPEWAHSLISMLNMLLILIAAWIVLGLTRRLIRLFRLRMITKSDDIERKKQIETLARVFGYISSVVISVVTFMLLLSELGISIAPILATAGVAGIAIGFGAQSLVKDYFTGFVMLIENQIRQGDLIEVAGKTGVVEEVNLRYVRLRDGNGSVHFVPNSSITTVTNQSREFAFAVMDIGISYSTPIETAYRIIRETGAIMREDAFLAPKILDDLDILGIDQWADSAIIIRVRIKVVALEQFLIRREFLKRLKVAFDMNGIEIPFPQRVVHTQSSIGNERKTTGE